VIVVMALLLLLVLLACFKFTKAELSPEEDQGVVVAKINGPPNATAQQMQTYAQQVFDITSKEPEYKQLFQITGIPTVNQGISGALFKPWDQRKRSAHELQLDLQKKWAQIAGAQIFAFQFPSLPGSSGYPVQFVISTTEPFQNLNDVAQAVVAKALSQHAFYFADVDLKLDKPQATIEVDRDKVAALGMNESDVGSALSAAMGGGYVNYFSISGRSYKVIPQVRQVDRLNPDQVLDNYIRTPSGGTVLASTVAHVKYSVVPESINRFQQLNSVTIGGVSGMAQGDILKLLKNTTAQIAPSGYSVDYAGQSRQFVQESGGFFITLGFAIIIVFLALAAQFESFRDPIVILVSVPLALLGAVMFMTMGFATLNIYTQVGLVTLLGLISKHGILIVQFANQLQRAGHSKREAIEEASSVRLRPILMTTFAMVLGVVPLVIASGAGAAGRHDMGLVIFTGLSIGTLFTLFVVPAVYMFIGADHSALHHATESAAQPQLEG
jgi:multidrug efflux pump